MGKGETSLATLGKITRIVIAVFILATIAYAFFAGGFFYTATGTTSVTFEQDGGMGTLALIGLASSLASMLSFLALAASFVLVAVWVYRAWANLHEAGLEGLNYTPGWATASFFIPFVNTVVPMRSLRELHNRSHGESDWHAGISVGDVTSWYACTWAAFLISMVILVYVLVETFTNIIVILPPLAMFGLGFMVTIFMLGSAFFLMRVIGAITAAQSKMLHYAQAEVFE